MSSRRLVASQNGDLTTHSAVLTLGDAAQSLSDLGVDVKGADGVLFSVEEGVGLGDARFAFDATPTNDGAGGLGHVAKAGETWRFAGSAAVLGLRLVNKVAGTNAKVIVSVERL